MNASPIRHTSAYARLAGLALALSLSVALFSTIAQTMHVERFAQAKPLVELDAVVITPKQGKEATELARAEAAAATQAAN